MNYNWYNLFNYTEFQDTGLVSRTLSVNLEGIGDVEILITRGNTVAIQYEDAFLPVEFVDRNPYVQGTYAVYLDGDNNVWLGIEIEEDE